VLYVTTRIGEDGFTSFRALSENRGPEGGFFVPMRLPRFDQGQMEALVQKTFSQSVADILNLFFGTQMDGLRVELAIGRYPVENIALNSRTMVVKAWNNPVFRFERLVCGLEKAVRQSDQINKTPSDWLMVAARMAVLFGVYGSLVQNGILLRAQKFDIALPSGNLSAFMAAWYARSMGLPIGTIVCCCNENNSLWNLFHKGELRTDALALCTCTPDCDFTVPSALERLIFATLGRAEVLRFVECCRRGDVYALDPDALAGLRQGIHVSVVSGKRMASTIPNLYKTTGFVSDPYTALAYSGLTDYRASTAESRQSLIISEESPLFSLQFVAQCMDMTPAQLKILLD